MVNFVLARPYIAAGRILHEFEFHHTLFVPSLIKRFDHVVNQKGFVHEPLRQDVIVLARVARIVI